MKESARRTFTEAQRMLNEIKQARGYFPVVGVGVLPEHEPKGKGRGSPSQPSKGKGKKSGGKSTSSFGRGRGLSPQVKRPHFPGAFGGPSWRGSPTMGRGKGRGKTPEKGGAPPPSPTYQPRAPTPKCLWCGGTHPSSACPNRGQGGSQMNRKRAFGSFLGMMAELPPPPPTQSELDEQPSFLKMCFA